MENASKALIIAGAILISILIIGLGVFIYNQASGTVSKANLNSQEAMAQNSQFTAYFGDKRSAADVKALCSTVKSNNITSTDADEQKYIGLVFQESASQAGSLMTSTKISKKVYSKYTYNINVANEKTTDKEVPQSEGANLGSDDAAYYKTGFLRVITIIQN